MEADLSVESGTAGMLSTREGERGRNDAIAFIGSKDGRNLEHRPGYTISDIICEFEMLGLSDG
jgi:hypothetical protein